MLSITLRKSTVKTTAVAWQVFEAALLCHVSGAAWCDQQVKRLDTQ